MTMKTSSPDQSSVLEQSSKGPWKYRWAGHQEFIIDAADCDAIAVGVDKADARLIAAAPDMLAALRECAAYIISPIRMTRDEDEEARRLAIYRRAEAVIAKATGAA